MFRLKISKWTVRLHAATVIAVVSALIYSALAVAPEFDHHNPSTQSTNELVTHVAGVSDDAEKAVPGVNCHLGLHCLAGILPKSSLVPVGWVGSSERQFDPHFTLREVRYLIFQPPRLLSQV
ncbi:MAG: hypothetical protein ABJN75_05415 [Hoeflea sp.]|uniref:hypothetical protein n=1 Tax=Hoeflea sp. TaxID=1940281 RepID=UPI0032999F42